MGAIELQEFPNRKVFGCTCNYCQGNFYTERLPGKDVTKTVFAMPDGWMAFLSNKHGHVTIPFRSGCLVQRFGLDVVESLSTKDVTAYEYGLIPGMAIYVYTEDELVRLKKIPNPKFASNKDYMFDEAQAFPGHNLNNTRVYTLTNVASPTKFLGMQPSQVTTNKYHGYQAIPVGGTFSGVMRSGLLELAQAKPKTVFTGQTCTLCGEFNEYAEPNRPDGTFQCRRHRI